MDNPSLLQSKNLFTYGYELEGVFDEDLPNRITDNIGSDGSVHIGSDEYDFSEHDGREFRSPIFDSLEKMLEHMRIFNEKVYYSNDSCGLHIHLKPVSEKGRMLFNAIASREGLKLVSTTNIKVGEIDKWQRRRREHSASRQYYAPWDTTQDRIGRNWRNRDKYYEVRNHPQGTYEFRLFSPQGTPEEREKRIVTFFLELFTALEAKKFGGVCLKTPKDYNCKTQKRLFEYTVQKNHETRAYRDNLNSYPAVCVLSL